MKASSPCRPASWYIRFLSAACGDMWQTHCMHVVNVRVPRRALSRQRGLAHRVIGKTCSWLHILGAEHVGVLPKCPSSLYAAWVFWVMGLERPLIPTNPPTPCRGWRMGPRFFWYIQCEAVLCGDHMSQAVAWWYMAAGAPAGSGLETVSCLSAWKREAWSWISAWGVNTGSRAWLAFELQGHTSTVCNIGSGDSNYCTDYCLLCFPVHVK